MGKRKVYFKELLSSTDFQSGLIVDSFKDWFSRNSSPQAAFDVFVGEVVNMKYQCKVIHILELDSSELVEIYSESLNETEMPWGYLKRFFELSDLEGNLSQGGPQHIAFYFEATQQGFFVSLSLVPMAYLLEVYSVSKRR